VQRDVRIDVIRGAGILMIALDHLGAVAALLAPAGFVVPFATWTRIGWSSAAEFFVFFSGYLIGLVYVRTLQARGPVMLQARAIHRSWQIYVANILTFCIVIALLYGNFIGSNVLVEAAQLSRFVSSQDAGAAWVGFLTLQSAPMFFEILQLYVILLIIAPLFLLLARASLLAALVVSSSIWLAVQINPAINLASWHFNPFAWQLAFVLGMLCSVGGVFARIESAVSRRRALIVTGLLLALAFAIKAVDKSGVALPLIGELNVVGIEKDRLEALRLVHFIVSVVFVVLAMPREPRAQASLPMRSIARIGRHSLECFCVSTIGVYIAAALLLKTAAISSVNVFISGALLVVFVAAFAVFMEWVRSEPWRGERVRKPAREPLESTAPVTGVQFAPAGTGGEGR
jgi:hypothetical protein